MRRDHLTPDQVIEGLHLVLNSPLDDGVLKSIVIRPGENQRQTLETVRLCSHVGLEGDRWSKGCWKKLSDGRPHPDVQVSIMNARFIDLIAGSRELWPLAGDNLYVDMDLSHENLPVGQLLKLGQSVLEVTAEPHLGCKKFALRFGIGAVAAVCTDTGQWLRLRGAYARVVQAGEIRVGNCLHKIPRDETQGSRPTV